MRCLHHFDADGYGAAAIVNTELRHVFDTVIAYHFVEYNHSGKVVIKDEDTWYKENDTLYIVDLALDDAIFTVIKKAAEHNMKIVHIDHHISGDAYLNNLSAEDKTIYDENVVRFFNIKYSGCMLTWIYSAMNEDERKHPMDIQFDLADDLSQLALYPDSDDLRVIGIPLAIRLIDDNDVWRHSLPESKLFAAAWGINDKETKHPGNIEFWNELLYEGPKMAYDMIDDGEIICKYSENMFKSVMHNSFEVSIGEYNGIAVNMPYGNSLIFGEAYDKYDFVIKYSQTGPNEWRYTMYSKEDGADCAKLIADHFPKCGGGHQHAGGFSCDHNIFDGTTHID